MQSFHNPPHGAYQKRISTVPISSFASTSCPSPPLREVSPSPSSSSSMLQSTPPFQRHPLLAPTKFHVGSPTQHSRQQVPISSSMLTASSSQRRQRGSLERARLSPLEAAARRASETSVYAIDDDEEQDDEDVETSLRFPTFARRPSQQAQRPRRPSPLRNAVFDLSSRSASISSTRRQRLETDDREKEDEEEVDEEEEEGDYDAVAIWKDVDIKTSDSDHLFHIDDFHDASHKRASELILQDDEGEDEESYGGLASPLFSIPPSAASHTTRRTSDHSSAADLDMIWDEEDEERSHDEKIGRRVPSSAGPPVKFSERHTSIHKRQPSSAPAQEQADDLGVSATLPFARKTGEAHALLQQTSSSGLASFTGASHDSRISHVGGAIAGLSGESCPPAQTSKDFRCSTWRSAGRKRSGTDPIRPLGSLEVHPSDPRVTRSVSASPLRREPYEDSFAELLETIRI